MKHQDLDKLLDDQHRITIGVEAILFFNRFGICFLYKIMSDTIINKVDFGVWKLVTIAFAILKS